MSPPVDRRALDFEWRAEVDRRLAEGDERMAKMDARMTELADSVDRLDARLGDFGGRLDRLSDSINDLLAKSKKLMEWVENFRGFHSVLSWAAGVIVRAAAVIIAGGVVWWFVTTGQLPRKVESSALRAPVVMHQPPQEFSNGRDP